MNIKEKLEFYREQIESNFELVQALQDNCDFEFDDDIDVENDILICGEKSNYRIYPFAKDSCGSIYVILDDCYVGFISSEGACGILASSIDEFFNFLFVLKNLQLYFYSDVFDNLDSFDDKFREINEDIDNKIYEKIIQDNKFITDIGVLYEKLKTALIIEPSFILQADPTLYDQWDDLFYSEQNYIDKLRKK